jgi:conjugative transfer region protein (TIGR03750 family)
MLNNINHKMAIYKNCTLVELMITAIATLCVLTLIFSIITKLMFGILWPGYLIASVLFFFVTKILLSKLEKLKYGKPYGFYQHSIIKNLSGIGIIHSRYVIRVGRWSVRRIKK